MVLSPLLIVLLCFIAVVMLIIGVYMIECCVSHIGAKLNKFRNRSEATAAAQEAPQFRVRNK